MMLKKNNERKITLKEFDFIQQNFEKIPFEHLRKQLKVNEYTLRRWLVEIYKSQCWSLQWEHLQQIIRHKIFLVELDQFIYIVEFDEAVIAENVKYCPIRLGVNYNVSNLSVYEFNRIKNDLLIFKIKATDNYVYDFWYTTQYFLNEAY